MADAQDIPDFPDLLRISAELGADPYHVQGPGGNTSLKTGHGTMLVKASGFELRAALDDDIFAELEPQAIVAALRAGAADPLAGIVPRRGHKPSIETALHALMPHRVVIHTHSVPAVALSCRADARALLAQRLDGVAWAFVPYARPGTPLAYAVLDALERQSDASVLVLGNHGIVAGGDTPAEAHALLLDVVRRIERTPQPTSVAPDLALLGELAERHGLALPAAASVHELALRPDLAAIATRGSLYPDHVIFLGPGAGILTERGPRTDQATPVLWLVPGAGVLLEPALPRAANAMARCLFDVVARLADADDIMYLSASDEAELLGMEEEVYRQDLARRMR